MPTELLDAAIAIGPPLATGGFGVLLGRQSKKTEVARIAAQADADREKREWDERLAEEERQRRAEADAEQATKDEEARLATFDREEKAERVKLAHDFLNALDFAVIAYTHQEQQDSATALSRAHNAVDLLGDAEYSALAKETRRTVQDAAAHPEARARFIEHAKGLPGS